MKSLSALLAATLAAGLGVAFAQPAGMAIAPQMDAESEMALVIAKAAATDLGKSLREALMAKMAKDGAVASIDFCKDEAPKITAAVAQRHGVKIGRIGVRARNPENVAGGWQVDMLQQFSASAMPPEQLRHISIDKSTGQLRFAQGIRIEPTCLTCHGASVAEPVMAAIREKYPNDAATGFSEGQLRGAVWVESPLLSAQDIRATVAMQPAQAVRLREEMRAQFDAVQGILAAMSEKDWASVADLADSRSGGQGRQAQDSRAGSDYRKRLPPLWFSMSRPMHAEFTAIAAEARAGKDGTKVTAHLAKATAYCSGCHASMRIAEEGRE